MTPFKHPLGAASTKTATPEQISSESSPSSYTTLSPSTGTIASIDTPAAAEPSPLAFSENKVVYLEGIPEHLGRQRRQEQQQQQHQNEATTQEPTENNKQPSPPPPAGFDDHSLESVLSSLEDAEAVSLDESYYFTPVEQKPLSRIGKLQRELQLRSELLGYLSIGQPAAHIEALAQEEATVAEWTLACAVQREADRAQRKLERRRLRQLQKQEQQDKNDVNESSNDETSPAPPLSTPNQNFIGRRPTAQEAVKPKSLFEPSPTKPQQQLQQHQVSVEDAATPPLAEAPSSDHSSSTPPSSRAPATVAPTTIASAIPTLSLFSYWQFEWYHGLPAVVSLLLTCVAHAALYELILAVVLAGMQPFLSYRILTDIDDNILEAAPGSARVEDICYGVVLAVGLAIARASGLLFSFSKANEDDDDGEENGSDKAADDDSKDNEDKDKAASSSSSPTPITIEPAAETITSPKERHLDPRRIDSRWAKWMYYSKAGRVVKGMLDIVGFYLCFVAIMYFLGRFSLCVDQSDSILAGMPSYAHQQQHDALESALQLSPSSNRDATFSIHRAMDVDGTCPSNVKDILLPSMMEDANDDSESSSSSSSSDDDDSDDETEDNGDNQQQLFYHEWDLPECGDEDQVDDHGNDIIYESGHEDEAYLFQHLSASTYHQFFGHGYRAAMFDLPHQLFFNLAWSVVAIYTLKRYFGCSFWEDW